MSVKISGKTYYITEDTQKLDLHSSFVANVAEYANTQNKVNKSDFFSNSKYHIDMKNDRP